MRISPTRSLSDPLSEVELLEITEVERKSLEEDLMRRETIGHLTEKQRALLAQVSEFLPPDSEAEVLVYREHMGLLYGDQQARLTELRNQALKEKWCKLGTRASRLYRAEISGVISPAGKKELDMLRVEALKQDILSKGGDLQKMFGETD